MWPPLILCCLLFASGCDSAQDDCEKEKARLHTQLRVLENRVREQQLLLHELRSKQAQASGGDLHVHITESTEYTDCAQIHRSGTRQSGLYEIKPLLAPDKITVYCDMSEGGGWTVFQRRSNGSESFDRPWKEYKQGFGNIYIAGGEFWLGNDNLHYLTSQGDSVLRITMEDFEGNQRFAVYRHFKVADEQEQYQLAFGMYSGTAGDSLSGTYHPEVQWWASHRGMKFSTWDRDNDRYERNCAQEDKAGWWFNRCHSANLNGLYYSGPYSAETDNGVVWYTWHGWWYSLKSVVMKVRPMDFEKNEV